MQQSVLIINRRACGNQNQEPIARQLRRRRRPGRDHDPWGIESADCMLSWCPGEDAMDRTLTANARISDVLSLWPMAVP